MSQLTTYPLSIERWDDFVSLFGTRGACGGCWCMSWRLKKSDFDAGKGDANKNAMNALVKKELPTGVIGYMDEVPVAWCAIAPREDFPRLLNSRVMKSPDDQPVWSVTCFFIAKTMRKQGVSVQLLKGVIEYCKKQGVKIIEAYPQEPKNELPAPFVWTGITSSFLKAGFKEAIRNSPVRPVMRYYI